MSKNQIASIALGAIHCGIIFQNVLSRIISAVSLEYPSIAADNLHLQLAGFHLPISPVAKSSKRRVHSVVIYLAPLGSTIMLSLARVFLF
jgi:hypothetical protein